MAFPEVPGGFYTHRWSVGEVSGVGLISCVVTKTSPPKKTRKLRFIQIKPKNWIAKNWRPSR